MADIQKIFTGMSQGPETIDKNLNAINTELQNVEGVTDSLQWFAPTDAGLIATNGLQISDGSFYTYIKIGNRKIVELDLNLTRTSQYTGANGGTIKWPSSIVCNAPMAGFVNSQDCMWKSDGTGIMLTSIGDGTGHGWNPGTLYSLHIIYTLGN